jgi:hypothetical protein
VPSFYQARLQDTVLRDADLRAASFFEADLSGADFGRARLEGASFAGARNIPVELVSHLDDGNRYRSPDPVPAPAAPTPRSPHVFLSAPTARTPAKDSMCARLAELLAREGLVLETLPVVTTRPSGALAEIARRLAGREMCSQSTRRVGFVGATGSDELLVVSRFSGKVHVVRVKKTHVDKQGKPPRVRRGVSAAHLAERIRISRSGPTASRTFPVATLPGAAPSLRT